VFTTARQLSLACTSELRSDPFFLNLINIKVKQSHYRPGQALRVTASWGSQISRQSELEGGKVVSPKHRPLLPPPPLKKIFLVLISVRGWVDPRAIVRLKGLCQWKIPIRNRTPYHPVCSAVPQPTAPPRVPILVNIRQWIVGVRENTL
jgi:hypothetical protein